MLAVLTKLEEQGIKIGRRESINELNRIYATLLDQGRNEDLMRAIKEPEFQKKILEEFGFTVEDEDEDEDDDESS